MRISFVTITLVLVSILVSAIQAADGTVPAKTAMFIGAAYTQSTVTSGTSKTVFKCSSLVNSTAPFEGMYVSFYSGTGSIQNQMRKVTDFNPTTGQFTLASALSATPAVGDKFRVYSPKFTDRKGRQVSLLANYEETNIPLSKYGGRTDKKEKATGYFHTYKASNGRWWFIDPDGYYYENMAVVSVRQGGSDIEKDVAADKWSSKQAWATDVSNMLKKNGYNGTGAWSDTDALKTASTRLPYTLIWNFMSGYGGNRTTSEPGHKGYPNDCIFVFESGFKDYCEAQASKIAATKNDPYLLGHFSDNELPFKSNALTRFLALATNDAGYKAAKAWMDKRRPGWTKDSLTSTDERAFHGYVVETYMSIVSSALKKADPNHMYLGSRFYGDEKGIQEAWVAAGKYCEAISLNLYGAWDPSLDRYHTWSGRPMLITEWYAMSLDSGLPCTSGAGFVVETQRERGIFYQNFTLGLLQSHCCVGWQWFMYQDNDPQNLNVDASNRTGNKGIVTNRYEEWTTLLAMMKEVNTQAYSLIDHFDGVKPNPPQPPTPTKYALTVNGGLGDGSYTAGTVVTITANAPAAGQLFSKWTGATVANTSDSSTTLKMPATSTTVTANYVGNSAPVFSSPATATPNPALTGDPVAFSALASDANGQKLTYAWSFGDGTTASTASATHVYAAAGTYTATVSVSDGMTTTKSSVTVTIETAPTNILINFQLKGADIPPGYLPDTGSAYGDRGNGYSYGWNKDNSSTARNRNSPLSADNRYDTLEHMQKPENPDASWKIALPNGSYLVRVVCGDPSHIDSVFKLNVQGVLAVNGVPTSTKHWLSGSVTATVTDGFLRITNASGAKNNKVCFIDISRIASRALMREESDFLSMSVDSLKSAIDFDAEGRDSLSVKVSLADLPAEFSPEGTTAGIDVLGATARVTLDAKGRGKSENATCLLKYNKAKKVWNATFTLKRGSWAAAWNDANLNEAQKDTPLAIPVGVRIGGECFGGEREVKYTNAKQTGRMK